MRARARKKLSRCVGNTAEEKHKVNRGTRSLSFFCGVVVYLFVLKAGETSELLSKHDKNLSVIT